MFKLVCIGCGDTFTAADLRKKRCKKDCGRTEASRHRTRKIARIEHDVQFMAVDGEGDTTQPGDPYVLLSVGDESLHRDGKRLTHHDIFPFLWQQYLKHPHHAFIGYFLGYDFSQWLKSISLHEAKMLFTAEGIAKRRRKNSGSNPIPFPVRIGDKWEIDLLGMKRFKLRPMAEGKNAPWMYICDVGPFFATSFLNAIDPKGWEGETLCTSEEYQTIRQGKESRDDAAFNSDMIRYNVVENIVLARMMNRLNKGFVDIDVRLSKDKWFGPGQAAQAWLAKVGAPTAEQVQEVVPKKVLGMARESYYGGWFEVFVHGHIPGTVYEYDINSAYPHIMRGLPCLLHGEWVNEMTPYTLVKAEVYGSDPYVGAMQHRDSKESILRPHATIGTYWLHELVAAKDAGLVSKVEVLDYIGYRQCECEPPLRGVADLYLQRLELGKNTVHGKACKGTYNSMYGKLAQSLGKPVYANPIYASLITSGCRTMNLRAIATHPEGTRDLVMVATDAVYFRSPHPGLELDSEKLGAWDMSQKTGMTILKPGVYWSDSDRESVKANMGLKLKSRGVSARDLAKRMEEFDRLFRVWQPGEEWPSLTIDIAFRVIGPKVALARNRWEDCGKSVRDDTIIVNTNPQLKRDADSLEKRNGAWCSTPYPIPPSGTLESLPYRKEFGMTDIDEFLTELTPDGTARTVIQSLWSR